MAKMSAWQKRKRFIELRGQGVSYNKIAAEIGSTKNTLIRWSREYAIEIKNVKQMEMQTLQEEYLLTCKHRIKVLAAQLNNVSQALVGQDLSKVAPQHLLEMQTKLAEDIKAKLPEIEFYRNIPYGGNAHICMDLTKTHAWEA